MARYPSRGCVLCGWQKISDPSEETYPTQEMIICPRCAVPIQMPENTNSSAELLE